jgi:hypothetical protein
MEAFEIKSTKDKLIITIDRSSVDAEFLQTCWKDCELNNSSKRQILMKTFFGYQKQLRKNGGKE